MIAKRRISPKNVSAKSPKKLKMTCQKEQKAYFISIAEKQKERNCQDKNTTRQ